jgi:polyphosphate:AMP phosphotransferase
MFESAELGHRVSKQEYDQRVGDLREALLNAQFDLLESRKFSVLMLISGVEGAGKGDTLNTLNQWLDPRHVQVHGFGTPTQDEYERPTMWRYWMCLPPHGKTGIFLGSWYTEPILARALGDEKVAKFDQTLQRIVNLESMLTSENILLLKYWFHLSKQSQKDRLKCLDKDPETRWRVTERDRMLLKHYDELRASSQHALRMTSTAFAPWVVVEGFDSNYRNLTVGQHLLSAIRGRLDAAARPVTTSASPPPLPKQDGLTVIRCLDYSAKLSKDDYRANLRKYQAKLNLVSRDPRFGNMAAVVVFEGNDAAGKGGCIRRVSGALDARSYSIVPVSAPSDEEKARPYLWRFWRHVPRHGRLSIFDRSWYGRELVERVEGFCSEADWMRSYGEINDFEHQLDEHGVVVIKFWLSITKDEQLTRFQAREDTPFKRFKITPDDWRNRDKWEDYEHAVCDMIDRTSTDAAPWHIIPANDKGYARVEVLKTICKALEDRM